MNRLINNTKKNTLLFYMVSISLHLVLLLTMVIFFDKVQEKILLGDTTQPAIQSYAYQETTPKKAGITASFATQSFLQNKNKAKAVLQATLSNAKQKQEQNHAEINKNLNKQQIIPRPLLPVSSHQTGQATEQLLALLHAAIQSHQQYPASAMEMQRQGRARIKFRLFPDGKIDNVHLEQSSGTNSLDQAAVAAVEQAAPFAKTSLYLAVAQEFSIDVVFELA